MLLALQQDKATVFAGTFGALAVMTVISVGIGQVFHLADEALAGFGASSWDDYLAVALLLVFGIQARSISHWSPYDRVGVVNADSQGLSLPAHLSAQGPSLSIPTHLDAFQLRF